jgi:hypothetical protein
LNAQLLGESATGKVCLGHISPRLSGASVEYRLLMLELSSLHPLDLSIVIDAGPGTVDLSLRSQFSLVLRCSSSIGPTYHMHPSMGPIAGLTGIPKLAASTSTTHADRIPIRIIGNIGLRRCPPPFPVS